MIRRASRAFLPVTEGAAIFFRRHGPVYSAAIAFNILLSAIPVLFLSYRYLSPGKIRLRNAFIGTVVPCSALFVL